MRLKINRVSRDHIVVSWNEGKQKKKTFLSIKLRYFFFLEYLFLCPFFFSYCHVFRDFHFRFLFFILFGKNKKLIQF